MLSIHDRRNACKIDMYVVRALGRTTWAKKKSRREGQSNGTDRAAMELALISTLMGLETKLGAKNPFVRFVSMSPVLQSGLAFLQRDESDSSQDEDSKTVSKTARCFCKTSREITSVWNKMRLSSSSTTVLFFPSLKTLLWNRSSCGPVYENTSVAPPSDRYFQ